MPDKQPAMLIVTKAAKLKTAYLERGVDAWLPRAACERADGGRLRMSEWVLELPDLAMEELFFADGCPADRLILAPHQQDQIGISTVAGGLGLTSAADRRFAA